MSHRIREDALRVKKLIRESEALSDEAMVACSKLKQAMILARQNPAIPIDAGQKALRRLEVAESKALDMSTNLLRVHDELSKLATEYAGGDEDIITVFDQDELENEPEAPVEAA